MKRYLRLWWKACLLDLKSCRLNKARCWAWCSHEGSLQSLAHCNRSLTSSTQKEVAHKAQRIRAVLFHKALYWRILENRIQTFQFTVLGFNLWHRPLCHKFSNLGLIMLLFWRTSANPWWATDYCQPPAWPWCWCRQVGHHDTGGIYETLNKSGYSNNLMGPVPAKYSHTRIKDSLSIYLFPRLPEEIYSQNKQTFMKAGLGRRGAHHDDPAGGDEKSTQVKQNSHSSRHISAVIRTLATLTLH